LAVWKVCVEGIVAACDLENVCMAGTKLVVFFEGTANTLEPITTQIGLFFRGVVAQDVTGGSSSFASPMKLGFNGCGVTHGLSGTLFASGLTEHCAVVVHRVHELLRRSVEAEVEVIAVGLSRGGVACIRLALALAASDELRKRTRVRLLLFDPVPGDSVSTGLPFSGMGAKDLRGCHNLVQVLALYPHEPLPDVAFHAPLLCTYPSTCTVEEDVTLGCHQGALFSTSATPRSSTAIASNLSFRRIYDFLRANGVELDLGAEFVPSARDCVDICAAALRVDRPTRRISHDGTGLRRTIVRRSAMRIAALQAEQLSAGRARGHATQWFLNRHHEQLTRAHADAERPPRNASSANAQSRVRYMLDIEAPRATLSSLMFCFPALIASSQHEDEDDDNLNTPR
jgi:hypothetical protein